jgi:integrase
MGVRVRQYKDDGAWWIFVDHKRRRKAVRVGTGPRAKRVADEAARQIAARLALGDISVFDRPAAPTTLKASPTFASVAREWLERYPALHPLRRATMMYWRSFTERHLIPFFGPMPVDSISVDTVESFIEQKRAPGGSVLRDGKALSDTTLRVGLSILQLILKRAVRRRLIATNPARDVEWRSVRVDHVDPFTGAELRAILSAADRLAAAERARPDFPALLRVWIRTGARHGEVVALQWQDLDLDAGTATLRRSYSMRRLGPTKTGMARTVSLAHPVPEATAEWRPGAIASSRDAVDALRRLGRTADPAAFVFAQGLAPVGPDTVRKLWRRTLAAAGVRYRVPEQLRHTFASTMLSRNAPLLYVQQQGGWRTADVLLKVYARWLPTGGPAPVVATWRNQDATGARKPSEMLETATTR